MYLDEIYLLPYLSLEIGYDIIKYGHLIICSGCKNSILVKNFSCYCQDGSALLQYIDQHVGGMIHWNERFNICTKLRRTHQFCCEGCQQRIFKSLYYYGMVHIYTLYLGNRNIYIIIWDENMTKYITIKRNRTIQKQLKCLPRSYHGT